MPQAHGLPFSKASGARGSRPTTEPAIHRGSRPALTAQRPGRDRGVCIAGVVRRASVRARQIDAPCTVAVLRDVAPLLTIANSMPSTTRFPTVSSGGGPTSAYQIGDLSRARRAEHLASLLATPGRPDGDTGDVAAITPSDEEDVRPDAVSRAHAYLFSCRVSLLPAGRGRANPRTRLYSDSSIG